MIIGNGAINCIDGDRDEGMRFYGYLYPYTKRISLWPYFLDYKFIIRRQTIKIAVTGKGGVGKTSFAATLARVFAAEGRNVLAADADPDANLGLALGFLG